MRIYLGFLVLISCCAGAAVNPTAGTAISRRPVPAPTKTVASTTTNSAEIIPKPTSTKITATVEEPFEEENTEEPRATAHPTVSEPETPDIATPPQASSPSDPTDYSTVWPTRWRPRRRFGAQSGASSQFQSDWKLILFMLISAILL